MSSLAKGVRFEGDMMWVVLEDRRVLGIPLDWFPVLEAATPKQRADYWISPRGLHWDEIDEDISVQGLLDGRGDESNRGKRMREEKAKLTAAE